jgi:hypothetical protein
MHMLWTRRLRQRKPSSSLPACSWAGAPEIRGDRGPVDFPYILSEDRLSLFDIIYGKIYYSVVGVIDLLAHLPVGDACGVVRHCDFNDQFANMGTKCCYCTCIKDEQVVTNNSLFHFSSSV